MKDVAPSNSTPISPTAPLPPSTISSSSTSSLVNSTVVNPNTYGDCQAWSNDLTYMCYDCQSCKQGFLSTIHHEWRSHGIFMITMSVILLCVHTPRFIMAMIQRNKSQESKYWKLQLISDLYLGARFVLYRLFVQGLNVRCLGLLELGDPNHFDYVIVALWIELNWTSYLNPIHDLNQISIILVLFFLALLFFYRFGWYFMMFMYQIFQNYNVVSIQYFSLFLRYIRFIYIM